MLQYRFFSHDGQGNFDVIQEFVALDDDAAAGLVGRWSVRPLELWRASRKLRRGD